MTRLPLLFLAAAALQQPPRSVERLRDYDVEHYRIELKFDERTHSFEGKTGITLKPLKDGFDSCPLDAETFKVLSVRDTRGPLRFEQPPGQLIVHLRQPHGKGERLSFTVAYQARNVSVDPEKFGMPAGYDLGLGFKAPTPTNPRLINTLSFPEGARHWFPSNDHPADKATAEIIATVDESYQAIANGRLKGVTRGARTRTFHWVQDKPHSTYLFVLVAGPYVRVADTGGALPVSFWVYPKDAKDALRTFGKTREIIRFFEREYGVPFPWAKYDQITIPRFGGGAESTSATVIGDGMIHDEKADKDFPSHWLVAHEAAHQWWGDLVTMRDWSEAWINESFATYGEYLYSKHSLGEDEGALNLQVKRDRYFDEARSKFRRPLVWDHWKKPNDNFNRHTYEKGAAILHMLRWIVGERDFQRAIARFLAKHAYEPVGTEDLRQAFRETANQPLDWFFEQWVYQPGHPVFEVRWEWSKPESKVRLDVRQKQTPLFRTPVDVAIVTAAGKQTERLQIDRRVNQTFEFHSDSRPLMVRFDEGNRLLMELEFPKSREELVYQLEHDDAMGRIWAASRLKNQGAEEALRRAARRDGFWAVRRAALEAVEGDPEFFRACALDPKPAVRAAAVRRLSAFRECRFFAQRFSGEDSYVVQADLLRAIGACGDASYLPLLKEAARMKSPRDLLSSAAKAALHAIGRK